MTTAAQTIKNPKTAKPPKAEKSPRASKSPEPSKPVQPLSYRFEHAIKRDWQLYLMLLPAVGLIFVFCYLPMYGIQIAFKDFKFSSGIMDSAWVGFKHFTKFFDSYYFERLLKNTFYLNIFGLLWGFPFPIFMAILLNQMGGKNFKKFTQTAIYAPHFISPVVIVGMLFLFLAPDSGLVNQILVKLGRTPINFMLESTWFRSLFVGTDVWQHAGWNTIIYIAALTAIDPGIYEAATIDGATKIQKILYIDVPHLIPIIIILLILNCGSLLVSNTDKAFLMQTPGNTQTSDLIGVYVYRMGIERGQFSYTAAIGLFTNVINFVTIVTVNTIVKAFNQSTLF